MRFEVPLGLVPHYLQTIMCKVDWVNQNCLLVVPAVGLYYRGNSHGALNISQTHMFLCPRIPGPGY